MNEITYWLKDIAIEFGLACVAVVLVVFGMLAVLYIIKWLA
jgi:hypothetical protein